MIKSAGVFGLAISTLMSLADPAFAHAHLKSATPPINGTVAAPPSELDLIFSEDLNLKFTGVKVVGADRAAVTTGSATLGVGSDATLVVPIATTLPAGTYTVNWHALSTDGHKTSGSYHFSVAP